MTLRQIFQSELDRYGVTWCPGPCRYRNSHRRGFATAGTIHLDSKIGTRRSLYRGLHELGHVALGHDRRRPKRRWQVEAEAEAWAQERMAHLGVEAPAEVVEAGRAYVARMKRWGDNISRAART
ncbi:MAG: hypothetical protein QOE83_2293 [Actinomycetota bacterium]|nr:hypothetical protein [Actinomycetota bacterium]